MVRRTVVAAERRAARAVVNWVVVVRHDETVDARVRPADVLAQTVSAEIVVAFRTAPSVASARATTPIANPAATTVVYMVKTTRGSLKRMAMV